MALLHSCHVFILVERKLEFAQQVLDQLGTKSAALNLKVLVTSNVVSAPLLMM